MVPSDGRGMLSGAMTVADSKGRRLDAATGIGFVVLALVALLLPGAPPKADDRESDVANYIVDKRGALLGAILLLGLASILFLWWLGAVRSYLRAAEGGEGRLSAAAFGGGVAGVVLLAAGLCALNAGAFKVDDLQTEPNLIRALFDLSNALFGMAGVGFAVLFGAASCSAARSGALPAWLYWFGSVTAVVQLLGLITLFAESGAFAAGGAIVFFGPILAFIWVAATSVVIMRRDGIPPVPRAEP